MYQENDTPFSVPFRGNLIIMMLTMGLIFLTQCLFPSINVLVIENLGLTTDVMKRGRFWTPATSILFHSSLSSIMWTLIILLIFGRALSGAWRKYGYLSYFISCAILGNLSVVMVSWCLDDASCRLGPNGGILATLAAAILLFGQRELCVMFITMKVKWLAVGILCIIALLRVIRGDLAGLGYFAGALGGWVYITLTWRRQSKLSANRLTNEQSGRTHALEFFDEHK